MWLAASAVDDSRAARPPAVRVSSAGAEREAAAFGSFRRAKTDDRGIVLVTGAAAFLGAHLVDWLLQRGKHVRILAPSWASPNSPYPADAEIVAGDCSEASSLEAALRDVELVYHLEELEGHYALGDLMATNAGGTENVLRASVANGTVRRVIFGSSVAVYRRRLRPGVVAADRSACAATEGAPPRTRIRALQSRRGGTRTPLRGESRTRLRHRAAWTRVQVLATGDCRTGSMASWPARARRESLIAPYSSRTRATWPS